MLTFRHPMASGREMTQEWLPGLEAFAEALAAKHPALPHRSPGRAAKRPPTIDKLVQKLAPKVRSLIAQLRSALLRERGVGESSAYDETAGAYTPIFTFKDREVLRLHLEPVLAATLVLDPGERQLRKLMSAPEISDKLKAHTLKNARKSGRRVFLALPSRSEREIVDLLTVFRLRITLGR